MRKLALLAAIAVTLSAPVAAKKTTKNDSASTPKETTPTLGKKGWGGAQWGMSVKKVLKAAGPDAEQTDLKERKDWLGKQQQGVVGHTVMFGYRYRVNYYFSPDKSKLSGITIIGSKKGECDALDDFFVGQLGEGLRTVEPLELDKDVVMSLAVREWSEPRDGNAFQFVYISDPKSPVVFCRIRISEPSTNWNR